MTITANAAPEGSVSADEIVFPCGLVGFPEVTGYRLERPHGGMRFLRLQGTEGAPGFLVLPNSPEAELIEPDELGDACAANGIDPAQAVVIFVATMSRDEAGLRVFINRRAPLVIDATRHLGFQVVLPRPDYPVRFALSS